MSAAIALAMSEPMGPVHLDLPEDVALAPGDRSRAAAPAAPRRDRRRRRTPTIARAGELIAAAKRPVAVIGSSAMRLADPSLLRKVIERHSLPFATTTMAKGLIDEDHRLSLGCIERACRQVQRKLLRSADLIVGLGYDTIEVEYEAWIGDVPLLQIDIEPPDVAPSVNLVHHVGGDLDASLARLAALPPATNRWAAQALADHRRAFQQALRPGNQFVQRACGDRRRAPRAAARRRARVRRRRAHPPDREPVDRACAEDASSSPTAGRRWASACRPRSPRSSRGPICRWCA